MPHFHFFFLWLRRFQCVLNYCAAFQTVILEYGVSGRKVFGARRRAMIPTTTSKHAYPCARASALFTWVTSDWLCSDVGVIRLKILLSDTHLRYIVVSYSVQ